ncbi:MAG TPA: HEAT repeat domain-containing protein, partial [Tepidisphaeraceae bacterium]|nr:HEAT repeat domain-containing protein [Tepidisphaeraceae bacterium]
MLNPADPDERWKGMDYLSDREWGRREPYTKYYKRLAVGRPEDGLKADTDYVVRAKAVRALSASRDESVVPTFIKALGDESDLVRLEAAKALMRVPDESAVQPLLRVVSGPTETRDVRVAAASALRHYKTLDVARALVNALDAREFEVAYQARRSLRTLTEKDFRYDQGAWLGYITGPEKPFG